MCGGETTKMKQLTALLLFLLWQSEASRRSNVNVLGTTFPPQAYSRRTGKPSMQCPATHPFSYGLALYCCMHKYKLNNTAIDAECNGGKSNPYSKIACCPGNDYVPCPDKYICKTYPIDTVACPFNSRLAYNKGFSCCPDIKRLNNQTLNPICNGGTLRFSDPKECCRSTPTACSNTFTGCHPPKDNSFNATRAVLLFYDTYDMVLNLSSNAVSASTAYAYPLNTATCVGSYNNVMLACECHSVSAANRCYRRVTTTDFWVAGPNMNAQHITAGYAMVMESKLWVIGGKTTVTELFDFKTQSWSSGPAGFPTMANYQFVRAAALDSNQALVVLGYYWVTGSGPSLTYLYDFSTGVWTQKGNMVTARWTTSLGIIYQPDGTQAVISPGGYSSGGKLSTVEIFSLSSGTWSVLPGTLPTGPLDLHVLCRVNGRLLLGGGSNSDGNSVNTLLEFNTTNLAFVQIGTLPHVGAYATCLPY